MQRVENRKSAGWHGLSVLAVIVFHLGCMESSSRTTPSGKSSEVGADAVSINETGDSLPQQASAGPPSAQSDAPPLSAARSDGAGELPREALFVDWPKPEWALMITGRQRGYLEPCGCAGRVITPFIKLARNTNWVCTSTPGKSCCSWRSCGRLLSGSGTSQRGLCPSL